MEIILELDENILKEEIAKQYAKLIYDKHNILFYGTGKNIWAVVEKRAIKILNQEGSQLDNDVKRLLKDKKFVARVVTKIIKEKTKEHLKEIYE